MKRYIKLLFLSIGFASIFLLLIPSANGQTCTGSTPANPGSANGTTYTGVNINPNNGLRNWFTGGTVSGANINISSNSTLIIKTGSFLTLTGATTIPSGSTIYIESGAGLSLPGSLSIQGTLINLGTLTITGNNFLQLNGGSVYNDGTINATSSYLHLTASQSFTFLNGGSVTFTYMNWQIATGTNPICLRPGSIFNLLSNNYGSVIAGSGAFPAGGLFQYNATDISSNSACTPANPARVNFVASFVPTNGVVHGNTGYVANNANITVVGSTPSGNGTSLGFGVATRVTSGTGYNAATPQNFNLSTHSPVPAVTSNYLQYCRNAIVPLASLASGTNLLWYTSATGGIGSSTAPTVNTATAGLQTFWVNQNVTGTCQGPRNPINIQVVATAANTLTASNNGPICTGGTLSLSATATGVSSWNWRGPNNYSSTAQNPTVSTNTTHALAGTYTIITTQTTGACNNSATTIVSIGTPSQPLAFTTSSATVCQGQNNVTYTVPAVSGATSYTWSYTGTGATLTGSTNSITINYSSIATSGTLRVTATNTCGTSAARTLSITVNPGIYLIPTANLITYYKLNGNANDELVTNQGIFQNAPTPTTDRYGNNNFAYSFNGTNQYVASTVAYNNPTEFTVSIWFKTTSTTGGKLIGFGNAQTGGSGGFDRHLYMNDLGQIYFGVYPNAVRTINSTSVYNNGVWHMATASLSGTNGMKLYVDGVLVASDATTVSGQDYIGYWRLAFDNTGGWTSQPSSNYYNGSLDDALIYHTELTASQVATLYSSTSSASSSSPVCNGGVLNLTAPTVSGASYSWTGPNGFSSLTQNPTVSAMSEAKEGAYVLTTTVSGCSVTSYAAGFIDANLGAGISQVPTSGLIARYKLDGNANDASGLYNTGTLQNAPATTSDRFGFAGRAYSFDGTNQFISTSTFYPAMDNLTMSVWFNTTSTNGGRLIGFGDNKTGQSGNYDRHIYMNNDGQIYFGVYPGGVRTLNSTPSYNDGNWHMATATLSTTAGMSLYIDGILIGTDPTTVNGQAYTGYFKIGYDNMNGWSSQPANFFFTGSIDDVLIYNTALSASQISNLYNAPEGAGSNSAVCINSSLNLTAPTVAGVTYSWTGPNSFSSSSQNPSFIFQPVHAGTYTLTATATNGCKSTAYALVKLNTTTPGLWTGSVNNSWQTANNWCGGALPASTTDVLIPAVTNLPTNSGVAQAKNITINASASLTNTNTGIINVHGNFVNNGTFTDHSIYNSAGLVNFTGTTAQSITGATTFRNLRLNNTAGLTLYSTTTVNGILTLTAGTLTTGGNLNQNLYEGAIAGTGTGSTSGNVRFFKTIWGDKYHYLSVPIAGLTAADWNDNVTVKFGANSNLYSYEEAVPDTNKKVGWTAVTSTADVLQSLKGYSLYFPRNSYTTLLDVTGVYTHHATFNSGILTNTPSVTPNFKPESDGWQLIGNPYPSDIDWLAASGWTKTNMDDAIYMWDGRTNRYLSFVGNVGVNGGTRYIGSMQGFFVKVSTSAGGSLNMNNDVRVTSILHDVWRVESEDKIVRLKISAGGTNTDETIIRFANTASGNFDKSLDAYKLLNDSSVPSLFSISSDADYSINSLPMDWLNNTIPLQLNVMNSGLHSWTADITNFADGETVYLEDRLLGTLQNLHDNPTYSQELTKGEHKGRFFIRYSKRESIVTDNQHAAANGGIQISAFEQNVFVHFTDLNTQHVNVSIFDALGKKIYGIEKASVSSGRLDIHLSNTNSGIYIVKVESHAGSKTQQVFIQR